MRYLINGKVVNITAITVRQGAIEALSLEPSAEFVSVLGDKGKRALAKFKRAELLGPQPTMASAVVHNGTEVSFGDKYQRITLECSDQLHARMIAEALARGLVKFSSKAE